MAQVLSLSAPVPALFGPGLVLFPLSSRHCVGSRVHQSAAPILAAELYLRLGPSAPWAAFAAIQLVALAWYPAVGVALMKDPDWKLIAAAAAAADASGKESGPGAAATSDAVASSAATSLAVAVRADRPAALSACVPITLLFLCGVIDMNDRMSFSLYSRVVQSRSGLSDTQLGLVVSSVTSAAALLVTMPAGCAVDRLPGPPLLASVILLLAACELLTLYPPLVDSFWPLFSLRFVASVVDVSVPVFLVPLACRLVGPRERPLALSLITASYAVGAAFANAAAPRVGGADHWQRALIALVVPPALLVACGLFALPHAHAPTDGAPLTATMARSLLSRLGAPLPALCSLYQLELCQLSWYPAYLTTYGHRSVGDVGLMMSASLVVQFGGSLCGAALTQAFGGDERANLRVCLLSALLAALGANAFLSVDASSAAALPLLLALCASVGLRSGPSYAILSQRAGADMGLATAFAVLGNNLIALTLGPTLVGLLSDQWTTPEHSGLRPALRLIVSACSVLAAVLWATALHGGVGAVESDEEQREATGHEGKARGKAAELM